MVVSSKNEGVLEMEDKIPWNLRDVLLVYIMRIALGWLLVRFIYPSVFTATPFSIEMTDRVVMIVLVWLTVHKYHSRLADFGLSLRRLPINILWGLAIGSVLLTISWFSERIYATMLMLTPMQHPLITQVENAANWHQLAGPLILAGIAAPIAEEILYRLFTFQALKERYGLRSGVVLSAAVFALLHFNVYWLPELIVVGAGLALLYHATGSLVSSIVAHSFINTAKIILVFLAS